MLAAGGVLAAEPVCDPDQPTHCAVDLERGAQAPFSGQLLTPELALVLGQRAERAEERCRLAVAREQELGGIEASKQIKLREVEAQACAAAEKRLTGLLEQAQEKPLIEHPAFVATISVVVTAGVLLGAWWLAVQTVQATAK